MGCIECTNPIKPSCLILSHTDNKELQNPDEKATDSSQPNLTTIKIDPQKAVENQMLNEINLARTNPKEYSYKITKVLDKIDIVDDKPMLLFDDEIQIELAKGKEAFESCIHFLNKKYKEMPPLILIDELKIPFPKDNDLVLDRDYLTNELERKNIEVNGRYSLIDFQYDISPNPIISTLIQIVDDSSSSLQRRKNIMNKQAKYIGISSRIMKKDIQCFYLLFAC